MISSSLKFLIIFSVFSVFGAENITFEILKGHPKELSTTIQKLRKSYYSYPYLYDFTDNPAEEDIALYNNDNTIIVTARKDESVVGMLLGIPLINFSYDDYNAVNHFKPFLKSEINNYYYICELQFENDLSMQKRYEIGLKLLDHLEKALKNSSYKYVSMLIVEREKDHPLRTENYFDEVKLLKEANYSVTDKLIPVPWTTRVSKDKKQYQDNPMRFWVKNL
ncbi:MAG: hypothetical protein JSS07_07050 [Proteobacteria bacterium]|nr:hypothetical protein [Pseudomonadota bacterium]